jgi:hypothetical protein
LPLSRPFSELINRKSVEFTLPASEADLRDQATNRLHLRNRTFLQVSGCVTIILKWLGLTPII